MSIFQHTFDHYVKNQLNIRQAVLKQGNKTSDNRFGSAPHPNDPLKPLPPGAFYTNTVERQCVLRMSSGVDITEQKFISPAMSGENADPSIIAKNWVLEGGIFTKTDASQYATDKTTGKQVLESTKKYKANNPRGGVFGQDNTAYNDSSTFSSPDGDFGIEDTALITIGTWH